MKFSESSELEVPLELNLTPLIDVLFTLLTFFMVTTSFVTAQGIKVNLPSAKGAEVPEKDDLLVVTVQENGSASIGTATLGRPELAELLKSRVAEGKGGSVVVRADRAATHGMVVEIMELAQAAGIERLAVATEKQLR